ncbi:hypothetical protein NP493_432g02019 [Ridgeia piscesae]|uniref:LamG-like jellyroll fold domain-containing protein n=1 Tax=Ridgeia piscesae TaxID=27915 RepID=A0AAD9L0A7_RIDPI|nr:hypothetical protein NP493_432g02019 [Ridgeia piscesae]
MQVLFILAVTVAGIYGQCPPFDAAVECPNADAGFVADACDKTCFYTCEMPDDVYTAVKRCCRACESWSQDILTCQPDDSLPGCEAETTTVMDVCTLLEGANKYSFILGDTMMVCPSGTVFNLTECKCVNDPNPVYSPMKAAITCITFSQGWNGLSASKGVYAAASNVAVVADCTPAGGNCGYFSAALGSSMNIPLFSNSYDAFSEFSVSLWFKRTPGKPGRQGLVGNGDCGASSSIGLMSEDENVVSVQLKNATDFDFTAAGLAADDDVFHHLAVVYDGSSVMVFIDGTNVAAGVFSGKIKRVYYPMVIGSCMCGSCNFDGYMDSISFAKVAFSPADVASLANNTGLCMPGPV